MCLERERYAPATRVSDCRGWTLLRIPLHRDVAGATLARSGTHHHTGFLVERVGENDVTDAGR